MDAKECILTRRSTRQFLPRRVEDEMLSQVIEAGRYAPSGGNSQTTHFIVIRSKSVLDELAALVKEAFSRMVVTEGMYASLASAIRVSKGDSYVFHYNAPVLIVTANDRAYGNSMADCACALENMMLMGNALDLGTCWINQLRWLSEDEGMLAFMRKLGLKDNERVYGALALGFPATETGLPVRAPLPRKGNPVTFIEEDV